MMLNHPRQSFMTKFRFRMGLSIHVWLARFRAGSIVLGLVGSRALVHNYWTMIPFREG